VFPVQLVTFIDVTFIEAFVPAHFRQLYAHVKTFVDPWVLARLAIAPARACM
jgi:hypothetical protein